MTKANFTAKEVEGIVKVWTRGGAYVSVPSAWGGKKVRITLDEEKE